VIFSIQDFGENVYKFIQKGRRIPKRMSTDMFIKKSKSANSLYYKELEDSQKNIKKLGTVFA
jgi:hypothetical protein